MIDHQQLISLIDLTSLNPTDSEKRILALMEKANLGIDQVRPASVCTYPKYANILTDQLHPNIKSCVVSTYFPSGQAPLLLKLEEIAYLNTQNIDEIDIVLPIGEFLDGRLGYVSEELNAIRNKTDKTLKLIIESGLLKERELITKATEIGLDTGMDFIKTSTGKHGKGADLNSVITIAKALKKFQDRTGETRGLKIAGGIKTISESKAYIKAVSLILGENFINSSSFRIGTSRLYDQLIRDLKYA